MSVRRKTDWSKVGPGTASVWAGEEGPFPDGATQVPLIHSVAFGYASLDEFHDVFALNFMYRARIMSHRSRRK